MQSIHVRNVFWPWLSGMYTSLPLAQANSTQRAASAAPPLVLTLAQAIWYTGELVNGFTTFGTFDGLLTS